MTCDSVHVIHRPSPRMKLVALINARRFSLFLSRIEIAV